MGIRAIFSIPIARSTLFSHRWPRPAKIASPLTVAQQWVLSTGEVNASHRSGRSCQNDSPMQELRISTNRKELDLAMIHQFLGGQSGWAKGIPLETLLRGIEHSICFGGFLGATQVAFARVISDCATFANLVDVFVLPAYRGLGYGKALMTAIVEHPQLQGLRRFTLATADAHGLYAQFGFTSPLRPQSLMERYFPDIYVRRC
jgi:GNAT superfamily N-acetyltransferase